MSSEASSGWIRVEGLEKHFFDPKRGRVHAVNGVSFTVRPGAIFGLLGPNGAGKTTTLRILSTSLVPDGGTVSVDGVDVCAEPEEVRRRIGFLSGKTGLYERSTAREILRFFGELYGIPREALKARIAELSSWLKMDDFLDRACGKLSTGQAQKVGIARCVLHDPPVIILDEPTSGLDVLVARDVLTFVEDESARGKTVLFSTHIMSEVERLCDDIAVIHHGRVLANGTRLDLIAQTGANSFEGAFFALVEEAERATP